MFSITVGAQRKKKIYSSKSEFINHSVFQYSEKVEIPESCEVFVCTHACFWGCACEGEEEEFQQSIVYLKFNIILSHWISEKKI